MDLEQNVDGVRGGWPWRSGSGSGSGGTGSGGFYDGVAFAEEEDVIEIWDGEGDARKLLGSVKVPKGVSAEEYLADTARQMELLKVGDSVGDNVGGGGGGGGGGSGVGGGAGVTTAAADDVDDVSSDDSDEEDEDLEVTEFWSRMASVAEAGSNPKRLHLRPW